MHFYISSNSFYVYQSFCSLIDQIPVVNKASAIVAKPDRSYVITQGPSKEVPYHIYLKRTQPSECVKKIAVYFIDGRFRLDGNSEYFTDFEQLMFRFRHRFVHRVENDYDIELFPYYVGTMEYDAIKEYLKETGRSFALRWSPKSKGYCLAINDGRQYHVKEKDGEFVIRNKSAVSCGEAIRNFLSTINIDYYENQSP